MTNGDQIRTMTDEELAKMFSELIDCRCCKIPKHTYRKISKHIFSIKNYCAIDEHGCEKRWLEWLKKEEETNG